MRILVDMNLTPQWCAVFARYGWDAVHWSTVGDPRASDRTILEWAGHNGYIVLTHDLDFGDILAATQAAGPSVIQVRAHDVLPAHLEPILIPVLRRFGAELAAGCLVSIDELRARVRVLPLRAS